MVLGFVVLIVCSFVLCVCLCYRLSFGVGWVVVVRSVFVAVVSSSERF